MIEQVELPPDFAVHGRRRWRPIRARSRQIADKLLKAELPDAACRICRPASERLRDLVELAETAGAAVWDVNNALNFPNKHPLCLSMDKGALKKTDLVVGLDLKDWEKQLTELNSMTRELEWLLAPNAITSRSASPKSASKWAMDYCRISRARCARSATPRSASPSSSASARTASRQDGALKKKIEDRKVAISKRHDDVWAQWQKDAKKNWDASPITFQRLAMEVWDVIKDEDWVLTANQLKHEVRKIWDVDKPYRHPGASSSAPRPRSASRLASRWPARRGPARGNIQPDGDLMFDAGALWIAAKYEIPMLVVMHNNRAYYNDWAHQIRMAKLRGTDEAKAHIGMDLFGPEPDFAALARSMGCYGEGPIDKPEDVAGARRAIAEVKKGRLALVDTITQHKGGSTSGDCSRSCVGWAEARLSAVPTVVINRQRMVGTLRFAHLRLA